MLYDALWPDELAGINQVGISNAVVPCQVSQILPIIARNPAQGIAAADHVIIAIIFAVCWTAVIISVVIPAGDYQHLSGVDVVTDPWVGRVKFG